MATSTDEGKTASHKIPRDKMCHGDPKGSAAGIKRLREEVHGLESGEEPGGQVRQAMRIGSHE